MPAASHPERPPAVKAILQAAARAPSSHNTQPWFFEVSGERISLYADRTRALPVNDPADRELTISCACALMNMRVAAADAGYAPRIPLRPGPDEDLLAVVELEPAEAEQAGAGALLPAIAARRTHRKGFESREVPDETRAALRRAAETEGAWLQFIDSDNERLQAARLIEEGDDIQWGNPSWRRELAQWMHPRRKGDGLTVPGLVAPVARLAVRGLDMGKRVGASDRQLAEDAPLLAVLGTAGDDPRSWLGAGQALQRLLLTACGLGLQCGYLNQPIQVAELRTRLSRLTGQGDFPQILLRAGYPAEELLASPRRKLEDLIQD